MNEQLHLHVERRQEYNLIMAPHVVLKWLIKKEEGRACNFTVCKTGRISHMN